VPRSSKRISPGGGVGGGRNLRGGERKSCSDGQGVPGGHLDAKGPVLQLFNVAPVELGSPIPGAHGACRRRGRPILGGF